MKKDLRSQIQLLDSKINNMIHKRKLAIRALQKGCSHPMISEEPPCAIFGYSIPQRICDICGLTEWGPEFNILKACCVSMVDPGYIEANRLNGK